MPVFFAAPGFSHYGFLDDIQKKALLEIYCNKGNSDFCRGKAYCHPHGIDKPAKIYTRLQAQDIEIIFFLRMFFYFLSREK